MVSHMRVDKTFNAIGSRTDRFGHGNDSLSGAVLLPDGKVIAAVQTALWVGNSPLIYTGFELVRINADGSRDATFGGECTYISPSYTNTFYWPVSHNYQPRIAVMADGKIFAHGLSVLMRCNPNGTLDTSFGGGDGLANVDPFTLYTMTGQPDGKLLLGGLSMGNFGVARLNADGSYDNSFDADGRATASLSGSVTSIVVQPDGKIVAAGTHFGDFAVARFNADGSLDTSFDTDGKVTTPVLSGNEGINALVLQPDGKIVAGGTSLNSLSSNSGVFALVRYNPDGSLDTTFDGDGKVTTPVVNSGKILLASAIYALSLQLDGKIVAAGSSHNEFNFDHVIARYNANGSLDTSFGASGFAMAALPTAADHVDDYAKVVFARPDGTIMVLGDNVDWNANKDISVRLYTSGGIPDAAFGVGGKALIDVGKQRAVASAAVVQPDGKVLVAGSMSTGSTSGRTVGFIVRYLADGGRDISFGSDGYVLQPQAISALAVGPGGKILAGGFLNSTATLVRYNADGIIDTSFDTDGKVTLPVSSSEGIEGMQFQSDGTILVLIGSTITRLTPSGSPDPSFDGDGQASVAGSPASFAVQADGKIVTAGTADNRFAVSRINATGSPDTSFDGDGLVTTDITGNSEAASVVGIQPDGKIVIAGPYNRFSGVPGIGFVRYNPDGSVDSSFGNGGTTTVSGSSTVDKMRLQPDGRIITITNSFNRRFIRLTAGGQRDTTFYADGFGVFANSKFSSSPVPSLSVLAFDSQGRIIHAGADREAAVNNDNRSMFVGRMEIIDHPYVHFDHDGDGKADLGVYRPSDGTWHILTANAYTDTRFGDPGDLPFPADFDGDGITDMALYRPSSWRMLHSESQTLRTLTGWGSTARPFPSDRDGDGSDDFVSVFPLAFQNELRSMTRFSESDTVVEPVFGVVGDQTVRGDFDGDGRADVAVYRPSNSNWYVLSTAHSQGFYAVQWGAAGDIPVAADYDGDGTTDIAIWRPSTGRWWIMGSSAGWLNQAVWGEPDDKPVPADYDGDGKTDIGVWRPSTGTWYIVNSADGSIRIQQFGQNGDIPLPYSYLN
jgi:uncharacterized delta-60 repeat protein